MGPARRHPVLLGVAGVLAGLAVAFLLVAAAVWRAAHVDEASRVDRADAILVLGAAQYGGVPSPVFRGRLDHAALLFRRGFADRIVVLGAGRPGDRFSEAEAGVRYLASAGLPRGALIPSPRGATTWESLEAAAELMEARGLDSAFLVSDPWHNLRIRRMARDLGIDAYVSATWRSAARTQETRSAGYAREVFAYLYYRVFGR